MTWMWQPATAFLGPAQDLSPDAQAQRGSLPARQGLLPFGRNLLQEAVSNSIGEGRLTLFLSRHVLWAMGALMLCGCGANTHHSDAVSDAGGFNLNEVNSAGDSTNSIADTRRPEGDVDDGVAAVLGCASTPSGRWGRRVTHDRFAPSDAPQLSTAVAM